MKMLKALALVFALTIGGGVAHAQGPGNPVLVGSENSPDLRGPDDRAKNIDNARDAATAQPRRSSSSRARAARPEDIVAGAEVRDSKGVVVGTIESVSMAAAVVVSPGGKVEVPLEAFGVNSKGLLIGMTKAAFDAVVAGANKPSG
ncbi:hypothetical protein [Sphingomonas sp. G-3-2-10]|uniref:hypothetical protein n=1 Tax=Sphingomonas sp. G-3-2-10 TaxID=2728838 RepID=UPI00146F0B36|nr:hypothetical protein [Sphingomonas sp. G-3-2-10]NML07684.1 hypothetical protein [Sphingomonas sp. G-3-2-10]